MPFVGHESSSLEDKAKSWNNLRIALSVILNLNIEQLPEFPLNADILDNSKITYFGSRENSYIINKMQDLLYTYFPAPK